MSANVQVFEEEVRSCKRGRTNFTEQGSAEEVCKKKTKPNNQNLSNRYEMIPEIPHLQLTLEQMNSDPITLLGQLEEKYAKFGAVRLTVNERWNCPFTFRYVDKGITTRVQCLQDLKHGKVSTILDYAQCIAVSHFYPYILSLLNRMQKLVANSFQRNYSFKTSPEGLTLSGKKEQEYWSLATNPQYEGKNVKVEYAADLPSNKYGSGFPTRAMPNWKDADFVYEKNLFNLNNIKNSPTSILRIADKRKQKISGITHPWVYMGMQFSTFCWHVQDLWVNSLNYNHKGSIKTWYIIPGSYKEKFDQYVKNTYCFKNSKKTLLNRITFMVDPLELIDNGIPVYKTYQSPRDYVCTFFKAYHCGFSQGYNIGQAVNFLSPQSLYMMKEAEKFKAVQEKRPPNVFPIDWIIHENYQNIQQFKLPKHIQIIKQSFQQIIQNERNLLKNIPQFIKINQVQIFPQKTKYDKYQCSVCRQYLFLHAFYFDQRRVYCGKHIQGNLKFGLQLKLLIREPIEQREELVMDLLQKYNQDFQKNRRGQKKNEEEENQKDEKEDQIMF